MHSDTLTEYMLVNYRWVFVVFFLLPCTVLGKMWAVFEKNSWSRRRRSTGIDHKKKVENIQCEVNTLYTYVYTIYYLNIKSKHCAIIIAIIIIYEC